MILDIWEFFYDYALIIHELITSFFFLKFIQLHDDIRYVRIFLWLNIGYSRVDCKLLLLLFFFLKSYDDIRLRIFYDCALIIYESIASCYFLKKKSHDDIR